MNKTWKKEAERKKEEGRGEGGQEGKKKGRAYIRKESMRDLVKYIRNI